MMPVSSVDLNSSHQVLEEISINSMTFMVMSQLIHKVSGTDNIKKLTSKPGLLPPKPSLWLQLSQGDLIIVPLIMIMLRFTLQSLHMNLTLNLFHSIHHSDQIN